jgi:hypothetical protein
MKFSYLILFVILFSNTSLKSQVIGGTEEKLAKLYNSGKYESCLYKAENLTFKEDYKRDPEPYLYMAMCFYELANSSDQYIREDYKDGLKQAVKLTAKFIKKDKKGEMYNDNIEFVEKIKRAQFDVVNNYFLNKDYRKSATASKAYIKLSRETDYCVVYFKGIAEILSNNLSQGNKDINDATEQINIKQKEHSLKIDNIFKPLLSKSFIEFSQYWINEKDNNKALEYITFGKKILPDDGYLDVTYNMIKTKTSKNE